MNILGKKVTLRAIEREDLDSLHRWGNDPKIQSTMGGIHFPSSKMFHEKWLESIQGDQENQRFAIESLSESTGILGISSLINIDWRNNRAWHGIMLGDVQTHGRGYGRDAVMATMRYAFDELHLKRLDGQMIEYNEGSVRFYCDKLGWKREGLARDWYYTKGRYWDKIIVGVTREDYAALIEATDYWGESS